MGVVELAVELNGRFKVYAAGSAKMGLVHFDINFG
jgi:hypothetical protein